MKILHITAHLGGGVGKALSGLCKQSKITHPENEHIIVCLEEPKDKQFFNKLVNNGISVIIQPSYNELENLMESSDIVQVEFWNHPLLLKYLCEMNIPNIRLVVWCHINGLFNPIIPLKLTLDSHKFIFTSPCSFKKQYKTNIEWVYNNDNSIKYGEIEEGFLGWAFSSGGFEDFPYTKKDFDCLSIGYVGTTNFSKMHPKYAKFINSINNPVKIIGNIEDKEKKILENQSNMFEFTGYVSDIVEELKNINVIIYLLNPEHYGTTENVLLEVMSMGIIPIILENPAEDYIVGDFYSGIKVKNIKEFKNMIDYLYNHQNVCEWLSINASESVRNIFSVENTVLSFEISYNQVIKIEKRKIEFKSIFGNAPSEWFLSCQGNKEVFKDNGTIDLSTVSKYGKYILFEESKGSVHHFSKYFPEDKLLKSWSDNMRLLQ